MKHIRLCLIALVALPVLAHAQIYLQQTTFSGVTSGWGIGTSAAQGSISVAAANATPAAFPTSSLNLSHVSANTTALVSTSPLFTPKVSISSNTPIEFTFNLRTDSTNIPVSVNMVSDVSSQNPVSLRLTSGGLIQVVYWNGSANTAFTLLSGYQINTTYAFTVDFTPSSGVFSASVGGGTASLVNGAFDHTSGGANTFTTFNGLNIINNGGNGSGGGAGGSFNLYVDGISVAAVPEPSTVCLAIFALAFLLLRVRRLRA